MSLIHLLVVLSSLKIAVHSIQENLRPIIGIYAQPKINNGEYIAASYVKWVESAGGRVVPIPYNASHNQINQLFSSINGLLFPGGNADMIDKAQYLYDLAVKANQQGDYFPVFGTCLGFEWLLQMNSRDWNILDAGYDAMNLSLPLHFTLEGDRSALFGPPTIRTAFSQRAMTLNNHVQGIKPENFYAHPKLGAFFDILATNYDRKGVPFVSAIQAKEFPIYGVQFHPEKNIFEWGTYPDGIPFETIDHAIEAIQASQYMVNFFVSQARRNTGHQFHSKNDEKKALIYNYHASMSSWPEFVEIYLFTKYNYPSLDALPELLVSS